ncbi:MAG: Mor transcription activator family protein [Gammaproteobacteria bacterium]
MIDERIVAALGEVGAHEVLPALLADLCHECGLPMTLRLVAAFGGQRLYVPHESALHDAHALVMALGWDAARAICRRLAPNRGLPLIIPNAKHALTRARNRLLRADYAQGTSVSALARRYGLHTRHIWAVLAQRDGEYLPARENPQADLPWE